MKFLNNFLLLLLCLMAHSAFCQTNFQEGYIVNFQNDTVRGAIDYRNWRVNPRTISFLKRTSKEPIKYSVNDIKTFEVASEKYVNRTFLVDTSSVEFNSLTWSENAQNARRTAFLRVLFEGRSKLFLLAEDKRKHFFIEEDAVQVTELLSKDYLVAENSVGNKAKYKGQLRYYWRKYPELVAQIDKSIYDENALLRLFATHETLSGGKSIVKVRKGFDLKFQAIAGVSMTKLVFTSNLAVSNLQNAYFKPVASPILGVALELAPLKSSMNNKVNSWSIYNELLYKKFVSEGLAVKYFGNQIETADLYKFGFSYLRLSSLLRYQFSSKKVKFFGGVGFSYANALKVYNNENFIRYYTFNTTNYTENKRIAIKYLRNYEFGALGALGVKYQRISLELRYEQSTGMSDGEIIINPTVHHLHMLCGYRFGKTKTEK